MRPRTSSTHPLRLDWLEMPAPWRVALTFAPGKHGDSFEGPPWARDLDADLAVVVGQGIRTLVCLMEEDELGAFAIPTLLREARARGLHVLHVPIVDGSIPTVPRARALVRELFARCDEPILIHCRGGLGRTGTIAGCLLRAIGLSYEDAIARLHRARGPLCPENPTQRAFVERFAMITDDSRMVGCLLGGAVGDALGAPIEFMKLPEIRARFGPEGIRDYAPAYGRDAGAITDDTQMTLFTAEGLIRAAVRYAGRGICSPPSVVMHAYMRWLRTQGETSKHPFFAHGETGWLVGERDLWSRRAPGSTCLSALRNATDDDLFATNDSKGCGGIMRVAPVGLVATCPVARRLRLAPRPTS